jgi:SAM-dependent methyltransferase
MRCADGPAGVQEKPLTLRLRSPEVLNLARSLASAKPANDNYLPALKLALDNPKPDDKHLTAFEENQSFLYASTSCPVGGFHEGPPSGSPQWVRRLIVLKPSIFVVDDETSSLDVKVPMEWRLYSQNMPEIAGRKARIIEGGEELSCETLLPQRAACQLARESQGEIESGRYFVKVIAPDTPTTTRFLHVLDASEGLPRREVKSELNEEAGGWKLTILAENRVFRLDLPPPHEGAGDIAISTADGKTLLSRRLFPSGILPHGPEGTRLLELWDADYRGPHPPAWDIGRPADELQKLVSRGAARGRRAVDLCCGSGTDAIYLAGQGFDVTALDIAPTALGQAERKAHAAGVTVRWVLADVLAPPGLGPFDFIYDRGCYHVVRDQNLAAYLQTVRRFSHPGSQFLLLAAGRDGRAANDQPSGVTEEELRYDFLPFFDLEWLREIRLESNQPGVTPAGWSALWRRKAEP